MNILIFGLGSIARKHIDAIKKLNPTAKFIALRSKKNSATETGISNIYSIEEVNQTIDFCIISNPTQLHFEAIEQAIELKTPLFIEKPSLMKLDGSDGLLKRIKQNNIFTYIAFNLRFHPILNYLKNKIDMDTVIEANVYCGSYLPDWRPNIDYSQVYSAKQDLGGGVHLDLIHEIDYSTWLFGFPIESQSLLRKVSNLKIDSKDFASYHLLYNSKTVNITLNYYRKKPKREIELVTKNGVITADLLVQKVWNEKNEILFSSNSTILDTYDLQMKYFMAVMKQSKNSFNTFEDSLKNLKICLQ